MLSTSKNLHTVQALRGIAALAVVLLHTYAAEKLYFTGQGLLSAQLITCNAGVDLFFVISGFIMVYTTDGGAGWVCSPQKFLIRRLVRIYPLYWFYFFVTLLGQLFLSHTRTWATSDHLAVIKAFLLLPQQGGQVMTVSWTLVHEVYFYLCMSLLLFCSRRNFVFMLMLWGVIVTALNLSFPGLVKNATLQVLTSALTLEFIGGALLGLLFKSRNYRLSLAGAASVILVSLYLFYILPNTSYLLSFREDRSRVIIYGLPSMLLCLGAVFSSDSIKSIIPRTLSKLGNASYTLYLCHFMIINAIARLWPNPMRGGTAGHLSFMICAATASVVCALIGHRLIERPMQKLSKGMTLRRSEASLMAPLSPLKANRA